MRTAPTKKNKHRLQKQLLDWYDQNRRHLPWRVAKGIHGNPYHIWLSEVMLQQTKVASVEPYFKKFISRWPTVHALARARLDDVLLEWAGLGYYARARNLYKCASILVENYKGIFPQDEVELKKLPGVGTYTAAAIAAIAFSKPATPVDGNFERVIARFHRVTTPLPGSKALLYKLATDFPPDERPGDYAQAMMDLGATICTPRKPKCQSCPWQSSCSSQNSPEAESLPRKKSKNKKNIRYGAVFWCVNVNNQVLVHRRKPNGLLGGMVAFPSTRWTSDPYLGSRISLEQPLPRNWTLLPGIVRHPFTHFNLELKVMTAKINKSDRLKSGSWLSITKLENAGLPSVMKKVMLHALQQT